MNKALILSMLIGGMWGNISSAPIQAIAADSPPAAPSTDVNSAKLELLTPGVEPRREVRLRPAPNSKQTLTMTMGTSMEMMMGEMAIPKMALPKVVIKIDLLVGAVDPSGDIHYRFSYRDIQAIAENDTPPELLATMQKGLKSMVGYKGDMVVSSLGQVKSKKMILPKNIEPSLKQTLEQLTKSMEQVSVPFPAEMLGVGAKWRVANSTNRANIQINQLSTCEIMKMDDRSITIETKINQSAPAQNIQLPSMDKKTKIRLKSLTSTGKGTYVLRFDSLVPVKGQLLMNTDSIMSLESSSKEQPSDISTKMEIDLNLVGN